jgi:putative DNA primase/helicase
MGGMGGMGGGHGAYTPPPPPEKGPSLLLSKQNPSETADLFVKNYAPTLMRTNDEFLIWRGGAYVQVEDAAIKSQVQDMLDRAFVRAKDPETGEMVQAKFLPKSKDVNEVVAALQNKLQRDALDKQQWLPGHSGPDAADLISFPNCILDVATGETRDPTPGLFTRTVLGFPYDAKAKDLTNWLNFLGSIFFPEVKEEKIRLLQQVFGYFISGRINLHKMFMLLGLPRSGKSLINRVVDALIGEKNIYSTTFTRMTRPFGLEGFVSRSLVVFPDAHTGQWTDRDTAVETMKSISGGDKQSIDRKHKKAWQGVLGARFLVTANAMPDFSDVSGAFAILFIIIQTDISHEGKEDTTLFEKKILPELPAIMNWALEGLADLMRTGKFIETESGKQLKDTMDATNNPVRAFAEERLTFESGAAVGKQDLYSAFRQWCAENGVREMSAQMFGKRLFTVSRNTLKGFGKSDIKIADAQGKRVNAFGGVKFAT